MIANGVMKPPVVALLLATLAAAGPAAAAQDPAPADTWVLTRVREGDTVMATAPFSNGITVIARCAYHRFDLILAGLPEPVDSSARSRQLTLVFGEDAAERSTAWSVASDRTAAFSRLPAPTARRLLKGGQLQIVVPAPPGGRRTRYVMNLGPSVSELGEVLTHCDRPLVDANDETLDGDGGAALPGGTVWLRPPTIQYPPATVHGGSSWGTVTLSCNVTDQGRPTDCEIESEFPGGLGFGQAARRGTATALIGLDDEGRAAGRRLGEQRIAFTISFRTAEH
jgi:hypothetical protein